jgi:pyruvate/2-oxoglutarate/acetoin dehydrogenase E1 component
LAKIAENCDPDIDPPLSQDAPVIRVTGADVPMPYTKSLEPKAVPQPDVIMNVVKRVLNR